MGRRIKLRRWGSFCLIALSLLCNQLFAQATPGYYNSADTSSSTALRSSLHNIIDDHTWYPYTDTAIDTWDILEIADENQNHSGEIVTIYRNANYPKQGGGNSFYNREHSWPKSYGFPNLVTNNYPYTDGHHLFLADSSYNSSRSNKPYRNCHAACSEKNTQSNNGRGGIGGGYPGDSNWTEGSFTQGVWEVWHGRRGDVARALMYMDVRYAGGIHSITGASEPDLILTDDLNLVEASNTGSNESVAYMGLLSVLIQWHQEDPVDLIEIQHHEAIYQFQGNRNPFIDHPEWVSCVFQNVCSGGPGGDTLPPSAPTGLLAAAGDNFIDLAWFDNTEADLAGYNIYRSDQSSGPYTRLNTAPLSSASYRDNSTAQQGTYYYRVTALDSSGNESAFSNTVSVSLGSSGATQTAWINEFHYDNSSTDRNEFVEIAGLAGTDLSGWRVYAYDGSSGNSYANVALSGILAEHSGCVGITSVSFSGLQNGAPDGLALVDGQGQLMDFISYEGSLIGNSGPAAGQTATNIGVAEDSTTGRNDSLQLSGNGGSASEFSWQPPQRNTRNAPNTGQQFNACVGADTTPPATPTGIFATALNQQALVDWNPVTDSDLAGYWVYRSDTATGPFNRAHASLLPAPQFTDSGLINGQSYYYRVTAVDSSSNESAPSTVVTVIPQAPISGAVWINEFHYDNDGTDTGEFIELAGPAGQSLNGWQLVAYNGNGGSVYKTVTLSGVIPEQQNQYGVIAFDFTALQNGAPDGIALVNNQGQVVQFISYEGTLTATDGPAIGMTSIDVGVSETSTTSLGFSLQLSGTGASSEAFIWQPPKSNSRGNINPGQVLGL